MRTHPKKTDPCWDWVQSVDFTSEVGDYAVKAQVTFIGPGAEEVFGRVIPNYNVNTKYSVNVY